jgi:hypothetical protein
MIFQGAERNCGGLFDRKRNWVDHESILNDMATAGRYCEVVESEDR